MDSTLKLRFLVLALYSSVFQADIFASATKCPCTNPKWCEPITDTTRKEVFAFSVVNNSSHWNLYDWSKVTTVVMFGYVSQTLMCQAHSHGVRVSVLGEVNKKTFLDPQLRKQWISHQLTIAKDNFLDGINFDYESLIEKSDADTRNAYTALVKETNEAFKKELPHFQVSVDVAWKPNVDLRYYDYVGLAENSDFLFVMAYDEQSQIFGECLAMPNSGIGYAMEGLKIYFIELSQPIPRSKLVLGLPWYGYVYNCIKREEPEKCYIKEVPFRGVNCSDAAGRQVAYGKLYKMEVTETVKWNGTSATPFFDTTSTMFGESSQVHFDNPYSLSLKYSLARDLNLRGVGMWNIDLLDYSNTPEAAKMRKLMFDALPGKGGQPHWPTGRATLAALSEARVLEAEIAR